GKIYDPSNNSWTAMTSTGALSCRRPSASVWTGAKFLIWGGTDANTGTTFNDGGLYDLANNSWTSMTTTFAPSVRLSLTGAWTGKAFIIWATTSTTTTNDGSIFNPATNSWTYMTTTNSPAPRGYSQALWSGQEFLFWGGCTTCTGTWVAAANGY